MKHHTPRSTRVFVAPLLIVLIIGCRQTPETTKATLDFNWPPQERLTQSDLEDKFEPDFHNHFFLDDQGTFRISGTRDECDLKLIRAMMDSSGSDGLHIAYGLNQGDFMPILYLYNQVAQDTIELVRGSAVTPARDGLSLDPLDDVVAEGYIKNYLALVHFKPKDGSAIRQVDTARYDAIGTQFVWDRLKPLITHNYYKRDQKLVLRCIAAELEKVPGTPDPLEYRHMMALHIATKNFLRIGYFDNLDDTDHNYAFAAKAADYGSLCPKNCPPKISNPQKHQKDRPPLVNTNL